jgi:uncharacterized membrane protein
MRGGKRIGSLSGRERYRPNKQDLAWEEERAEQDFQNVGETERTISALIGGGLLLRSLMRPSWLMGGIGALIGAVLIHRGVTGRCALYGTIGVNTADDQDTSTLGRRKVQTGRAIKIEHSISINRSPQDLFRFWRNVENLPKVMKHVRSVEAVNDRLSHWVVETIPGAPSVEWDAEIINEVKDERIGWRTLHGASVTHAGSVEFQAEGDGGSTRLTVTLQYDPPAGPIGATIASWLGQDPKSQIAEDLSRFKEQMESERQAVK